jgi:MarR family transcriptional regulator, organic hydroperoxide resistance regulator
MKPASSGPLPPLDQLLCFSVYRAGLAFNQLYRGLLTNYGLTYPQFLAIVALQQKGTMRVNDLGKALHLESNTLTPMLKRLEFLGLITRQRSLDDERVVHISLTRHGADLSRELGCVPPQVAQAAQMTAEEAAELVEKLQRLEIALRAQSKSTQH